MKSTLLTLAAVLLISVASAAPPPESEGAYTALQRSAEREYAEKSFSRAHELYEQAAALQLSANDRRWVDFRLADTAWRADASAPDPDDKVREKATKALQEMIEDDVDDRIEAEASESLADLDATHPHIRNPYAARDPYLRALDYWAGSDDLPLARRRYLAIVWKMLENAPYGPLSDQVLVNAVQLAETPEERAHARMALASQLLRTRTPMNVERAMELLDEVIREGKKSEWYDDALFMQASALAHWGEAGSYASGDPERPPDYVRGLELFRRLITEFSATESEWWDDAKGAIRDITSVSVDVAVESTFLPRSQQEVVLNWRNARRIELALYAVDLTEDVTFDTRREWKDTIRLEGRTPLRRWTHETNTAEYHPGSERLRITPRLEPGAYVMTARAGEEVRRELILVTDAHITVHTGRDRAQVFVSHVETGEPIANARVRVWIVSGSERPASVTAQTDANGLASVKVPRQGSALITAAAGSRQAYHQTYVYSYGSSSTDQQWRIYAFTDRPAYRPNETVQWKIIARVRDDDRWRTPSQAVDYVINDPRGNKVASGVAKLNAFGSFWSELALTPEMPLGIYSITFTIGDRWASAAQLFRLEEYKLPEFLVKVSTPEGKQYRLGETIEATIDATYYFGGPVANAEVEAVVYQSPFVRYWYPWRTYEWYWREFIPQPPQSILTTQTLRTDANGRAIVRIDTPRDGADMSYRIEARVVDASRREVRGQGTVRVTRQRYTVMAQPEHFLHRPGDSVSVKFRAVDANDRPVQTTGTVTVVRRHWREREYVDEDVLTTKLNTDAEGEATLTFTPKTAGYYAVRWVSIDGDPKRARDRVVAETTVWVADRSTTDIGYYQASGIDIIVDKEALRSGETASVMLVAPASGRWIVLTSSADDILETRVLHLDGTVKLVQFPIDERHVPNFYLTASSVFDRQLAIDSERVVVPPVEQFLTVDVKSDREEYEPRQEGTLTITTRDASGKPVPAEVAVAVSDEAVTAIQADLAGDPRQFFYGDTRQATVSVSGSLHSQRYLDLQEKVLEERDARLREEKDGLRYAKRDGRVQGGVEVGAYDAVAEAISVTASAPAMNMPAPAAPPPPMLEAQSKSVADGTAASIEVQVRSDFRSTALWKPDLVTDANGTGTLAVRFPESLTTWRATVRAATTGSQFGSATSTARTNLPLLVRLQAPRFFVAGDRSTVSAVINNNTNETITVTPSIDVEGLTLSGGQAVPPVQVAAHSEGRADWTVIAERAGNAKIRVTARGGRFGDAMEKPFVVYEHGIDKLIAKSGKLRGDEALVRLELPRERRSTELTVQIAPSLAVTMLDALPYLVDFPYGCTEQTMSRFLPAAIVAQTLRQRGLDPETRLPKKNLDAVTAAGMARLYDMQHGDGGWGWWKEGDSDDFMTAYVVWGFAVAREGGLRVDEARVNRAEEWLLRRLIENKNQWNEQAWILHALSAWRKTAGEAQRRAFENVWKNRERLTAYSRALFALTAHRYGFAEQAAVLVRNLENGVQIDRTPDQSVLLKGETTSETMATAHWGSGGFWWRWYEGPVETTAFVLQALVTIDPKHKLVEPAMNWLIKNRTGTRWSNTRDTAIALLALNDYMTRSGELQGNVSYELTVNGKVIAEKTVSPSDVLRDAPRFSIDPSILTETLQEIRIRRTGGTAPLYFAAEGRFFSLEEPIQPAGNEIFVRREYFRFRPRPTLLKGIQYDKVPLRDNESIASGDRVEVVVTIESKNDYEYLIFEDLKPAGLEAVELQSGQSLFANTPDGRRSTWVYQELRDRKVAMFIDKLPQGLWEIRYVLRAETPGRFHALPLMGHAMYAPHIRANGEEVRISVIER